MIYPRLPARLLGGICILLIALGGCGTEFATADPTRDEAAIYAAIFSYIGRRQQIHTIDPETNRGPWIDDETVDCGAFQTDLVKEMPEIMPNLASDFCGSNQTARPVNPEVIRLLALDTADMYGEAPPKLLKVSTIQLDPTNQQALVFVQLRDSELAWGGYLLLARDADGQWLIRYEKQSYTS